MGKIHPKKKLRVNYATAIAKKARAHGPCCRYITAPRPLHCANNAGPPHIALIAKLQMCARGSAGI